MKVLVKVKVNRSQQMDKTIIPIGDEYRYVKYVYRYLADNEEKVEKEKAPKVPGFVEIDKIKKPIKEGNRYVGWVAIHLYKKKLVKEQKTDEFTDNVD